MTPIHFIVTGWRRSGTTMFVSLLNDHPEISCDNDSFNYFYADAAHWRFLRGAIPVAKPKDSATVFGLKTLDPFLVPDWTYRRILVHARRNGTAGSLPDQNRYSDLIRAFTNRLLRADPLVINVVRHALYVYVSEQIAIQRREFRYRTSFDERFSLVFDIDDFSRWMRVKQGIAARTDFLKRPERTFHVFYEDFRSPERRQLVMDEVFRHLGVAPHPVKPATRKQLPDSLKAYVLNYDEMIAMIGSSDYPQLAEGL